MIVTAQGISMSAICAAAFVFAIHFEDYSISHARCLVFTMLVLIQLFHAFLSRSFTESVFSTGVSDRNASLLTPQLANFDQYSDTC